VDQFDGSLTHWKTVMFRAHIAQMRQILLSILAIAALTGCAKWDEAAERAACEKSNPGQPVKAEVCYERNKQAYDVSWASRFAR